MSALARAAAIAGIGVALDAQLRNSHRRGAAAQQPRPVRDIDLVQNHIRGRAHHPHVRAGLTEGQRSRCIPSESTPASPPNPGEVTTRLHPRAPG